MKAEKLQDICISSPELSIIIEMPNGQKVTTNNYYIGSNKRGEAILIITAGRKIKRK